MFPPLGAWQNRRSLASAAFVPPQWARLSLHGAHLYWYQFPVLVLNSGQTNLTRVTVTEDFWALAIMASSTSALAGTQGTFRAQIYEDETAYKYSKYGVNQPNLACTAREPGLMVLPSYIPAGLPINCKVQNLDAANANTVNLCLYGVSAWWRK